MTISLVRGGVVVVAATLAMIAALQLSPERRPVILSVYLLVLGAVALRLLVRLVQLAHPPAPPSDLDAVLDHRPQRPGPPAELESVARMLALASASGVYVHNRLRPELRAIARELLSSRLGIDMDAEPAAASAALGPEVWELVRPDRKAPDSYETPGMQPAAIARVVADLEGVSRL